MAKVLNYDGLDHVAEKIYGLVNAGSGADFVQEQGTSAISGGYGTWYYRKWASGIGECWCTWEGSLTEYTAPAGFHAYYTQVTFPFTFYVAPSVNYTAGVANSHAWQGAVTTGGISTTKMNVYAVSTATGTNDVRFQIHAKGLWKAFTPNAIKSATLDTYYPVGSIYMTINNVNPANLFGGTWEQIKDKFLLSAGDTYSAGGTGGEANHQLTTTELPSNIGKFVALRWGSNTGESGAFTYVQNMNDRTAPSGTGFGTATYTLSGGNTAHNNMPPYLTVYVWKRTA